MREQCLQIIQHVNEFNKNLRGIVIQFWFPLVTSRSRFSVIQNENLYEEMMCLCYDCIDAAIMQMELSFYNHSVSNEMASTTKNKEGIFIYSERKEKTSQLHVYLKMENR